MGDGEKETELQGLFSWQGPHHHNMSWTVQAVDDNEDKWIDEQNGINVAEEVVDLRMDISKTGDRVHVWCLQPLKGQHMEWSLG